MRLLLLVPAGAACLSGAALCSTAWAAAAEVVLGGVALVTLLG